METLVDWLASQAIGLLTGGPGLWWDNFCDARVLGPHILEIKTWLEALWH